DAVAAEAETTTARAGRLCSWNYSRGNLCRLLDAERGTAQRTREQPAGICDWKLVLKLIHIYLTLFLSLNCLCFRHILLIVIQIMRYLRTACKIQPSLERKLIARPNVSVFTVCVCRPSRIVKKIPTKFRCISCVRSVHSLIFISEVVTNELFLVLY
ncbi:unnamed protein product, partial [Amoebophrya sp. A120]